MMNIQKKLYLIGIEVDINNGHLFYTKNFKPLITNFDLVFIRHGETFGNCGQSTQNAKIDNSLVMNGIRNHDHRIFQGNVDTEINQLTEYGKEQSLQVAKQLEDQLLKNGWYPDLIFHSPLSRARDTGLPFVISNGFRNRYVSLDNIREMSFGAWENRRICDMKASDDCHLFYKKQHALVKNTGINGNGVYQHSENFCEVLIRAYRTLFDFNQLYCGKKMIVFSHSMFGAACCILLGKGQQVEFEEYLAFDGRRSDGSYYTIPNASPYYLSMSKSHSELL